MLVCWPPQSPCNSDTRPEAPLVTKSVRDWNDSFGNNAVICFIVNLGLQISKQRVHWLCRMACYRVYAFQCHFLALCHGRKGRTTPVLNCRRLWVAQSYLSLFTSFDARSVQILWVVLQASRTTPIGSPFQFSGFSSRFEYNRQSPSLPNRGRVHQQLLNQNNAGRRKITMFPFNMINSSITASMARRVTGYSQYCFLVISRY